MKEKNLNIIIIQCDLLKGNIVMRRCKFINNKFSLYLHHIGPPLVFTNLEDLLGVLVSTLAGQVRGLRLSSGVNPIIYNKNSCSAFLT